MASTVGVTLTYRAPQLAEIQRRLAVLRSATEHTEPLMKRIAAVLENSTRNRFRTGVSPEGVPWKPSARVLNSGRGKGKTLVLSARLRDSITSAADATTAMVGTNVIYSLIHQVGGVIQAKAGGLMRFFIPGVGWRAVRQVKIPARPYVGVSADDRTDIADQVRIYIARSVS